MLACGGEAFEDLPYRGLLARADETGDEDVCARSLASGTSVHCEARTVARTLNFEAKLDCLRKSDEGSLGMRTLMARSCPTTCVS